MPRIQFQHVAVTGVATCVGPQIRRLEDETQLYGEHPEQIEKVRRVTGVTTRVVAPAGVTSLDLCEQAARRLLTEGGSDAAGLDAVVCVTQTPDFCQPSNANLLHGRLGLAKTAAAFDVNQGCSGWVYGLYLAACMVESGGCERVLLLAGDTVTQCVNPRDRAVVPLFGDAGTATLVERRTDAAPSWFALHSDGRGWESIIVRAGASRCPRSPATAVERPAEDGSVRSDNDLLMNGVEVFNFTLREEPAAVRELLAFAGVGVEGVDAFVFHQANKLILDTLALRLKLPREKVPVSTLARFGNQSSASVPAALCEALGDRLRQGSLRTVCSAFGVGLSWASCLLTLGPLKVCAWESYGATFSAARANEEKPPRLEARQA